MDLVSVITADDLPARLRADPALADARDDHGVSALLLSIYHRRPQAREALLAAGAEVGPLEAAALGDLSRLEVDARGPDGFTPLHLAAFFGGADAVRVLLAAGAPPDPDAAKPTPLPPPPPPPATPAPVRPLPSAAAAHDHAAVAALLQAGADPDVRQQGGYTPLLSAAHADDPEMTRMLLDAGADPDVTADDGRDAAAMAGPRVRELLG